MQLSMEDQIELSSLYNALRVESDVVLYVSAGREGDRMTYVGKLSMADVVEHFPQVPQDMNISSHIMIQRDLDRSRAKGISDYIDGHKSDFIFPSLMAIVETFKTEHVIENIYKLTIPGKSFRYLVDGQGRRGGAEMLIEDAPEGIDFAEQSFDIKLIESKGINADNQVCVDVNTTPKSFNQSQKAAMDTRKVISLFSKEVVMRQDKLLNVIDFKRASVTSSSTSPALWTLNQIGHFIKRMTGVSDKSCQVLLADPAKRDYLRGFIVKWFDVISNNVAFADALSGFTPAPDVRKNTIIGSAVFLKSLALVAKVVKIQLESAGGGVADWSIMSKVSQLDFSHDNPEWIIRCKNLRGGYEDKSWNHQATAAYILSELGIPMPQELVKVNAQVKEFRDQSLMSEVANG